MKLSDIEWVNPGGQAVSLNSLGTGCVLTDPPDGLIMPPPLLTGAAVFNRPGQILEQATFDVRTITLHVAILGESLDAFTNVYSFLASQFNPLQGFGALRCTRDDGSSRDVPCIYAGGLEGTVPIGMDREFPVGIPLEIWAECDLQFTAYDPYFLDSAVTTITYGKAGTSLWFPLDLAGGLDLASSGIFDITTITNAGDDIAWPIWIIDGPVNNPAFINLSTGAIIDLSAGGGLTLTAGERIVVDTGAGTITLTTQTGTFNAWPALTPQSDLWPLLGGDNQVQVVAAGADASSNVRVTYRLRWLTM